jgi:hypothetical protein
MTSPYHRDPTGHVRGGRRPRISACRKITFIATHFYRTHDFSPSDDCWKQPPGTCHPHRTNGADDRSDSYPQKMAVFAPGGAFSFRDFRPPLITGGYGRGSNFKTCALNHSATLPDQQNQQLSDSPSGNRLATRTRWDPRWTQPVSLPSSDGAFPFQLRRALMRATKQSIFSQRGARATVYRRGVG